MSAQRNQEIAFQFLEQKEFKKDLLYVEAYDCFALYKDGYYQLIPPEDMRMKMWNFVREVHPEKNITTALINDLLSQCVFAAFRRAANLDAPYIALKDTLINLETFTHEKHDREKPVLRHLPILAEELLLDTPIFDRFLKTTFVIEGNTKEPDLEMIDFIQEVIGYYLLPGLRGVKVFFFIGGGSNGKSVIADLLAMLMGEEYVSAMSIEYLTTDRFASANLVGKVLNICSEEESKFLRSDKFKAIITGDLLQAERKYGQPFRFRPRTKFLFCSNLLPTFEGWNYGLSRRIHIIPFFRRFTAREQDQTLIQKLKAELPGILEWALIGAKRFVDRGYVFVAPKPVEKMEEDFENSISSVIWFIRDQCDIVPDDEENEHLFTSAEELYSAYKMWCDRMGKKAVNFMNFGKEIHAAFTNIVSFVKSVNGKATRVKNVVLKEPIKAGYVPSPTKPF